MLVTARQWGELGGHVPDACANIVMNPRRPVARFLSRDELQRLGAVLDRHADGHPWPVAAIRLLTLTGARLSEVLNLRWEEIGEWSADGASARLGDSKTGPRTLWLGPEAVQVLAALPRPDATARVFPEDVTTARLYTFWVGSGRRPGSTACASTTPDTPTPPRASCTASGSPPSASCWVTASGPRLQSTRTSMTPRYATLPRRPQRSLPAPWATGSQHRRCGRRPETGQNRTNAPECLQLGKQMRVPSYLGNSGRA